MPSSTLKPVIVPQERLPSKEKNDLSNGSVTQARKQPKSPQQEARLAAKYAAIDDLGERAYTILKDLDMI